MGLVGPRVKGGLWNLRFRSVIADYAVLLQVLYYYVQLLIRKEELLIDPDQRFARLLHLYYLAMDHKELHQCLKILYTQTSLVPMKRPLTQVLR